MDLVEAADIDALAARLAGLEARSAALQTVADVLAGDPGDWVSLRERARAALEVPVPEAEIAPDAVIEAWGCPVCGRVDAPQPCLGVCVRRPVLMADAAGYRELAAGVEAAERRDEALGALAHLVVHVTPRPGQEERTRAALAGRARQLTAAAPSA
jgi:hypothetical protein